ncbi:glutathione S-transferase family protein [Rhodopila sp.]|uniref:glutathione S-transferase family protein n=1 Tax=Rhodopila sp. TaxID=2480087 RepID=UPI002C10A3DE|nr:glutathione S-transferase family protein [Rhodopila sp.]HVZ08342.1 glutathione S-transferase family protein [Rhodopila sp.]
MTDTPGKPRLYHAPSSYYSMIARLALAEGHVDYDPVYMDIHVRKSQQEPGYVRLNPNMTVPTLVLADRVLDQSRAIAEYALGTDEATLDAETKAWLDRHYAYPIEELTFGHVLARNPVARVVIPRLLRGIHRRLLALAAANPDLAPVYRARAAVFAERVRTFDPAAAARLWQRRRDEAIGMLDRMEQTLADGRATMVPPAYGIADTILTVFLARIAFTGLGNEIAARPALLRYWRTMQARPSFAAADIWTQMHFGRLVGAILGFGRGV